MEVDSTRSRSTVLQSLCKTRSCARSLAWSSPHRQILLTFLSTCELYSYDAIAIECGDFRKSPPWAEVPWAGKTHVTCDLLHLTTRPDQSESHLRKLRCAISPWLLVLLPTDQSLLSLQCSGCEQFLPTSYFKPHDEMVTQMTKI